MNNAGESLQSKQDYIVSYYLKVDTAHFYPKLRLLLQVFHDENCYLRFQYMSYSSVKPDMAHNHLSFEEIGTYFLSK